MIWAKVEVFAKQQYSKITSLLNECKCSETGKIVSKDLGDFYTKQHTYTVQSSKCNVLNYLTMKIDIPLNTRGYHVIFLLVSGNI